MNHTCRRLLTRVLLVLVTGALLGTAAHCFAQAGRYAQPSAQVDIASAVPIPGGDERHFKVDVTYAFNGRNTVWLQGIGDLPAAGTIRYIVQDQTLIFRETKTGVVLASVAFQPTIIAQQPDMGNPFPPSVIQGAGWQQDAPIMVLPVKVSSAALKLPDILENKTSSHLSFTPCRPDDDGCILSEWVQLTSPAENTQVQLGLMLVYSPASISGKTTLKIYYVGRQALLGGSTFSYVLNSTSLAKCATAVRGFRTVISANLP